jgi:hypothetical protein
MGIIKKLKKIVRHCVAHDWIEKDPFMNYKVKIRETDRPFLLQDELDRIINKQILINGKALAGAGYFCLLLLYRACLRRCSEAEKG